MTELIPYWFMCGRQTSLFTLLFVRKWIKNLTWCWCWGTHALKVSTDVIVENIHKWKCFFGFNVFVFIHFCQKNVIVIHDWLNQYLFSYVITNYMYASYHILRCDWLALRHNCLQKKTVLIVLGFDLSWNLILKR